MSLLKTSSRGFFVFFIIVLFFLSLILSLTPNHVQGNPDWLSGWSYRKSHVINSATGAGTDYQTRVKVSFSTSSPTSWLEILPTNIPVFMTTDVSSDGTVFAGDRNYEIYKSIDSGLTFSNIYTIPAQSSPWGVHAGKVWTVFVDSRDYLFISVGSTNRLYRSTNGGTSFTEVLNLARPSNDGMIISMTEDASGNLYAAEYANVPPARLWKSTDGGVTWSSLRGWSARHHHAVKINPYNGWLYVVVGEAVSGTTEHQTVWRSKDGGNNWQLVVARGSGTDTKYLPIEFIDNDVYLGQDRNGPTDTDYIQKITDDGVSEPFTPVTVYYNPYPAAIFTAATKLGDTIIFTTSSEGYTSTCQVVMSNDGSTWTVLNAQPVSPAYRWINELTVHPRKGIVYGCININYAYFIASPSTPRPPPLQAPLDTVFAEGHCRTDFGDVRFTDDDETTLLDYWMETKVDGDYAIFWVKVADDLSSDPATIHIYYGNPTATTTSNGPNTFLFFDDFNPDLSKWTQVSGTDTWTIESGNLVIQPLAANNYLISANDIGANNIAIRTKMKSTQTPIPSPQAHPGVIWHANTQTGISHRNDQVYFRPHDTSSSSTMGNIQPAYYIGTGGSYGSGMVFHSYKAGSYYNWNTWYTVEVRIPSSGNVKLYGNDLYWHDWGNQQYSNNRIGLVAHDFGKNYFDYVAVRKFVDPEPSHGDWGAEEAAASAPVGIAAKYDLDDETKENDPTIGTEFTPAMYGAIASSDDLYAVTRVLHTYDYSQQIFRFDVAPGVTEFTVAWEGNIAFKEAFLGSPGPHYEGIDIWNSATSSWEYLGNVSQVGDFFSIPGPPAGPSVQGRLPFMAPDEVISKTYKTNVNNYITGGYVYIMVWAKNSHDATICTDHVSIGTPTPPVGGVWVPINKFELLAPWIGLASFLMVSTVAVSVVYVRHRKKQQT